MKISKKLCMFALAAFSTVYSLSAQEAKYVFYFIGDGMGQNQIQLAELYQGELDGFIGVKPLLFTQFPQASVATNFSVTNGVTDSAASGTALATGSKTANGCISVASDKKTPLKTIAARAKEAGKRVAVSSSVGVNHATPAAFYAHDESRKHYNAIGRQLPAAGFDFYAGSDFWGVAPADSAGLYNLARDHGYTIARGFDDYKSKASGAEKMLLFQPEEYSKIDCRTVPYAIDRDDNAMTLSDIVTAGIDFLTKDGSADKDGFFFMIEGGNIDWQCHSNDAASVAREVIDFDKAVGIAYDFYKQHPDETLIVVTADHETGGLYLGTGSYDLNLKALASQTMSDVAFSRMLLADKKANGTPSVEKVMQLIKEKFGLGGALSISEAQQAKLNKAYEDTFGPDPKYSDSEYQITLPIAKAAKEIVNEIALVGWGSGGHSASFIPLYVIGVGAERFSARSDNARIPRTIAEAGGFPVKD